MNDILGYLHFRDFFGILQQQKPNQEEQHPPLRLLCCCLLLLVQLHDWYTIPPDSLKAILSRFPLEEVHACRQLIRIAARAAEQREHAEAAGARAPSSAEAEALQERHAPLLQDSPSSRPDEGPSTELQNEANHPYTCLWACGGEPSGAPSVSLTNACALDAALRRFTADVAGFAAAAAAGTAAKHAFVASGMKAWGPLLPLLLPVLYPSLPTGAFFAPLTSEAAPVGTRRKHPLQPQQQPHGHKRPGTSQRKFSTSKSGSSAPASSCPSPASSVSAAHAGTKPATQLATTQSARATRQAALHLCAEAVSWQWQYASKNYPPEGLNERAGDALSRFLLGTPYAEPGLNLAKPFLAVILNSSSSEEALAAASQCIEVLIEHLRFSSFSIGSPFPLILGCIGSCSPSLSTLLVASLSSPDLPLHSSPVAALQLALAPSAETLLHAAARKTLSLAALRAPPGAFSRADNPHGHQGALKPGLLGAVLRRKGGPPHHKAELLLSYYVFCFDYEKQQTQRLLAAAAAVPASSAAPDASGASHARGGGDVPVQLTEETAVADALLHFLEEAATEVVGEGGPPCSEVAAALATELTKVTPYDLCGATWGVFAVAEIVGLIDLNKAHARTASRLRASLAHATLLGLRHCCLRAERGPQREAEVGALTSACSLMLGESLRHQDTWEELTQRLGVLLYSQGLGGPPPLVSVGPPLVGPLSSSEEIHAVLRSLLPRTLPVSPFLSLRAANHSLFAFVFQGFLDAWQAWGLQTTQPPLQQHEENEAVREVLTAHISSAAASFTDLLSPLSDSPPDHVESSRASCGSLWEEGLSVPSYCAGGEEVEAKEGEAQESGPDFLLSLQCLLFVCQCGREAFAAALCSSPREVLKQQGQGEGGGFFGLPYGGLQRWMHLVASFATFLEGHTAPTAKVLIPTVWSPLDYPTVLLALQRHAFPSVGAAAASLLGGIEAAAAEREGVACSCLALMLLYLVARMHSIPYFRGELSVTSLALAWLVSSRFSLLANLTVSYALLAEALFVRGLLVLCCFSVSPALSHGMLRLFSEALQSCLPEASLLEGPLPPLTPSELLPCENLHPAALAEADLADPISRAAASLALEPFPLATWTAGNLACKHDTPDAFELRACLQSSATAATLEADCEELQLYLASEPLAGVAAAVCCLIDAFFERHGESPPKPSRSLDWSPVAEDVPAELPLKAVPEVPRFTEAMLDAHYLCTIQNPLNLLLHLPADVILKLLTANVLAEVILTLLLKLETYAYMGPPALPGRLPEPIAADEIVQLQETAAFQVVIEACCFAEDEAVWELVGRFLDRQANRRPQSLDALFASGFSLEAVDQVCRCTKEVQRLLPLLCRLLRQNAAFFWETKSEGRGKDATSEQGNTAGTPVSTLQDDPKSDPADGVRIKAHQTVTVHPALAPMSRVDLCLFYLKCVVCVACDLRDNRPYPGETRETDPSFASENANAVFLEAIKHSEFHESRPLCEFVAAAVPIIFPLFYTFPKLAALVSTFLAHRKLLRHDGNLKAPSFGAPCSPQGGGTFVTKKRADAVLEKLEQDLSRIIELDL
ncbi:uncharacterized protein LOC34618537 [Cyclospora cayetanensis]|uniref:Uncharacterized protein LOC34618537 n=1 Tax=Cyclospora cayetanensis TaxID=88456 RepID=A0A6P6S215_9EIME|nr:uncharacterized protein LOC34618537 [Cyclospora cayetanensis]